MSQDKLMPTPFTYAYRYPTHDGKSAIRFGTSGREINGSKPIEAIPLYREANITRPTTDVSTDGLVERGRKQFARVGFGLLAHELCDRIEALERSNAEKDEALIGCATALHSFIVLIAQRFDGDCTYYWMRDPTREEAQAAMIANNNAIKALSHSSETASRIAELEAALQTHSPYGLMCQNPLLCHNRGYCPRNPTCGN